MSSKFKWIFVFVLVALAGLFYFSTFMGFTFVAPNIVSFEINESWNLSNGFLRVSQGANVYDVNDLFSLVEGNQIVVNLDNFNLTDGEVYVDLAIDETVVASERVNYVVAQESSAGPLDEITSVDNFTEEIIEEEVVIEEEEEIIETMSGAPPTQGQSVLNSTFGTNLSSENLTVYNITSGDSDGDNIKNIYNWYMNSSSLTVLNMPFEGGSSNGTAEVVNNVVKDYSPYGNNASTYGTALGIVSWCSDCGYDGFGAYEYPNINDVYLNVSDDDSLNFNMSNSSGFSVELRFKNVDNGHNSYLFSKGHVGGSDSQYRIMYSKSLNQLVYRAQNTSEVGAMVGSSTIVDNIWYHVVMVVNSTQVVGYLDGEFQGNNSHSMEGVVGDSGDLIIGNYWSGNLPFNGSIDEFRIWDRPLTGQQVLALYNNMSHRIVSQETNKTQIWNATVEANDGSQDSSVNWSNSVTILNSKPVVSLNLSSTSPYNYTNGSLFLNWSVADNDSDTLTMNETRWWKGSVENTTFANFTWIESANFTNDEVWNVSVREFDGDEWGNWSANESVTINKRPFDLSFLVPYVKDVDIVISLNLTSTRSAYCEYRNSSMSWTAMAETNGLTHGQILNLTDYNFYTYYIKCNDSDNTFKNETMSFATVKNIPTNSKGYEKVNFTANQTQNFSLHLGGGYYAGNLSLTTRNNISGAYVKFVRISASTQMEVSTTGLPNGKRQKVIAIVDENVVNNLSNSSFYVYNLGSFSDVLDGPYVYQFNISSLEWNAVANSSVETNATMVNTTNFRTLVVAASVNTSAADSTTGDDTSGGSTDDDDDIIIDEEDQWYLEYSDEFNCGPHVSVVYDYLYADEMITIDVYDPCIGLLYVEFTPNIDINYTLIDFFREGNWNSNQYKGFDMSAQNIFESDIQEMNMVYAVEKEWIDDNFIGDCSLDSIGLESEAKNRYYGDYLDEDDTYYYFVSEDVKETGIFYITAFDCLSSSDVSDDIQDTLDGVEERDKRETLDIMQKSFLLVFIVLVLGNLGVYYSGKMFLVFGWSGKNYYSIEGKSLLVKDKNIFKLKYYLLYNLYMSQDMNKLKVMLMNQGWDINVVEDALVRVRGLPRGKLEMFVYSKMANGMGEMELVNLLVSKGWEENKVRGVINSFKRV
jgi:hypothetical protein